MNNKKRIILIGMLYLGITGLIVIPSEVKADENVQNMRYNILMILDEEWGGNCPEIISKFKDQYEWNVTTASLSPHIEGCSYVNFKSFSVDLVLSNQTNLEQFHCISLLPGKSHANLLNSNITRVLIQNAINSSMIVSAWCNAVRILAKTDVLNGRNITGSDSFVDEYVSAGATFNSQVPPVRDGNLITAVRSRYYRTQMCQLIKDTVEESKHAYLSYSSFLGGSGSEKGGIARLNYLGGITFDSRGNIIMAGRTESSDFPVKNAIQSNFGGKIDVTVSKFSSSGKLLFSTYLGGNGFEWATAVHVDSQDNIVVAGITGSGNFPTKNAYSEKIGGGGTSESFNDVFITKIAANGSKILYSTCFGGTGGDWCYDMAVGPNDRIGFTGTTFSGDLPLKNAAQPTNSYGGDTDGYYTVLSADGQSLDFCTYLSDGQNDQGRGVAFDTQGNLFGTGKISQYLSTENVFQNETKGFYDAYCVKFNQSGNMEFFSSLGGSKSDIGNGIAIDDEDNAYIIGSTNSEDFPINNAFQSEIGGYTDAFLSKISKDGHNLLFSTFYGGSYVEEAHAVSISSDGNPVITGQTESLDLPVSTWHSKFETNSTRDLFIAKFKNTGDNMSFGMKLGGRSDDIGISIASYKGNRQAIMGFTYSEDYPVLNAVQTNNKGNCDMFISLITTPDLDYTPILPSDEEINNNKNGIGAYHYLSVICLVTVGNLIYNLRKKKNSKCSFIF